jgi:hypothetical protein
MKFASLPGTVIPASRIALGTAWFGTAISEEQSFKLMDAFIERGGNFLDTAHMYANWVKGGAGKSETTIGRWLRQTRPGNIVIATKGADGGMTRDGIRKQFTESLDRLQLEKVDFYWLHRDDPAVPAGDIIEWLAAVDKSLSPAPPASGSLSNVGLPSRVSVSNRPSASFIKVASKVDWPVASKVCNTVTLTASVRGLVFLSASVSKSSSPWLPLAVGAVSMNTRPASASAPACGSTTPRRCDQASRCAHPPAWAWPPDARSPRTSKAAPPPVRRRTST